MPSTTPSRSCASTRHGHSTGSRLPDGEHETAWLLRRTTSMTNASSEFLELQAALAGEYSLQRELGRGGMGIVYLARDVQLDRDVAIKVLPSHLAHATESRERFIREART